MIEAPLEYRKLRRLQGGTVSKAEDEAVLAMKQRVLIQWKERFCADSVFAKGEGFRDFDQLRCSSPSSPLFLFSVGMLIHSHHSVKAV